LAEYNCSPEKADRKEKNAPAFVDVIDTILSGQELVVHSNGWVVVFYYSPRPTHDIECA